MNIFITLDYELFFGKNSGTIDNCIITPTNKLLELSNRHNAKLVFFVDSGYLLKLKEFSASNPNLKKDYDKISMQIKEMSDLGHDIQLHIHPHWEDAVYKDGKWIFDLSRYRLDSFSEDEIVNIFKNYKNAIFEITGKQVFAYRAGGWCIQPFSKIKKAFIESGIFVDSTVYYKGKNNTNTQWFDFSKAPNKDIWTFENDPCNIENKDAQFIELPISSLRVNPLFFWEFAAIKKMGKKKHNNYGDGISSPASKKHLIKLLTKKTNTVASIDGYKSKLLRRLYKKNKMSKDNLVLIGHPKSFSQYSLEKLDSFLGLVLKENNSVVSFSDFFKSNLK